MVIVVVALAECETGYEPAIAAAVPLAMRLCAEHVAKGIDRERRVQHHEHPEHSGKHEAADAADHAAVQIPEHERKGESRNHDGVVVPMLPHDHRIFPKLPLVNLRPVRGIDEEPHAVTV